MTKDKIRKRVGYWMGELGLHNWRILVKFEKVRHPKEKSKPSRMIGVAVTSADPQYKDASITFRSDGLAHVDDEVIIHELLHCLTSNFRGYIIANVLKSKQELWLDFYEEQLVSELSRIMIRIKE